MAERGDSFSLSDDKKPLKPSYGSLHDAVHDNSIAWREAVDKYKTAVGVSFEDDLKGNHEFNFLEDPKRRRLSTSHSSNDPYVSLFGHNKAVSFSMLNIFFPWSDAF